MEDVAVGTLFAVLWRWQQPLNCIGLHDVVVQCGLISHGLSVVRYLVPTATFSTICWILTKLHFAIS